MGRASHTLRLSAALAVSAAVWLLAVPAGTAAAAESSTCQAESEVGEIRPPTAPSTSPDEHDEEVLLQATQGLSSGPKPAGAAAAAGRAAAAATPRRRSDSEAPPAAALAAAPPAAATAAAAGAGGWREHLLARAAMLQQGARELVRSRWSSSAPADRTSYAAPIFAVSLVIVASCSAIYLATSALGASDEQREGGLAPNVAARGHGQASRQSLPAAVAASMRSLRNGGASGRGSAASLAPSQNLPASLPALGPCSGRPSLAAAHSESNMRPPQTSQDLGFARSWRLGGACREDPFAVSSPASCPPMVSALPRTSSPRRLAEVASAGPNHSFGPGGSVGAAGSFGSGGRSEARSSSPLGILWPALVAPGRGGHLEVAIPDMMGAADGGWFFIIGPLGQKLLQASVERVDGGRMLSLSLVNQGSEEAVAAVVTPSAPKDAHRRPASASHVELDIFGPEGKRFGTLVKRRGGPYFVRKPGQEVPVVVVNGDAGEHRLTAAAGDGRPMASAARARRRGGGPEHLEIRAQPGVDTALMLACMLSIILPL